MAVDRKTGKRKSVVKNPLEIKKERAEKAAPKAGITYEEELIKSLFENNDWKKPIPELEGEPTDEVSVVSETQKEHRARPNEEWDVPIAEEILYFDPELSYELTGYRPITMEKGLDFNPEPFREMAAIYEKNGKYTEFPEGSKPWRDLWMREIDRMKNGYTIGRYRITGDNYYFLNYYRMQTVPEDTVAGTGRSENFPSFLAKQYEWFHYVELAERCHKDAGALKARGTGWSEMTAAMSVRPYTTNRGYSVLLTCEAEDKLQPLRNKCWLQLDWLNMNTSGGLRHVRQKINNNETKRASKLTRDNQEFGWMSEINSIVADNPNKIRGNRVDRLIYEEAGSSKNLVKAWIQGAALTQLGGIHFGSRVFLGTGGDTIAVDGISTLFANPHGFDILPYRNYDTFDGKPELTAFFAPAHKFALSKKYLDNRGVTNWPELKKYYEAQRSKLSGKALLDESAEHCFIPEEALAKTGGNVFDAELISQQMVNLKINNLGETVVPMALEWDQGAPKYTKVNSFKSPNSKLLVIEPPLKDENGSVYNNLYVAGIDGIDIGGSNSAIDNDVSDFCIVIKRRVFGGADPKYVAIYKDRPSNIETAYWIAFKLLLWYNCKAMFEFTKVGMWQFLRSKGREDLLMERPEFAVSVRAKKARNKKLLGVSSSEAVIKHGLELIDQFVVNYYYTIDYVDMLEELLKYTYENKRKFDMIAAMSCCEIGDEAMTGINPVKPVIVGSTWQDIGWYRDERGYLRRGVIPNKRKY